MYMPLRFHDLDTPSTSLYPFFAAVPLEFVRTRIPTPAQTIRYGHMHTGCGFGLSRLAAATAVPAARRRG